MGVNQNQQGQQNQRDSEDEQRRKQGDANRDREAGGEQGGKEEEE